MRTLWHRLQQRIERLFHEDLWAIGIIRRPVHEVAFRSGLDPVEWLVEPGNRHSFLADPFLDPTGDRPAIMAEAFSYFEMHGRIVSVTPAGDGSGRVERISPVLEAKYHLSYPFTIEFDGEFYATPEMGAAHRIELYKYVAAERLWKLQGTLLDGVAAIDPTPFLHDGRWWMLFTDQDIDSNAALCLAYAPALHGPWKMHPHNPVRSDISNSRPAGSPFFVDGKLYRPAQDCSKTYGGRVAINEITNISTDAFEEKTITYFEPDPFGAYPDGCHTLSAFGNATLIDGKRARHSIVAAMGRLILRRLHRIGRSRSATGRP